MWARFLLLCCLSVSQVWARDYTEVEVAPVKTSIYLGYVHLKASPLQRDGTRYTGTYQARVVPLFFASEKGSLFVNWSEEQMAALLRGERVTFTGEGLSEAGESRRIEGHVEAAEPGAEEGKIKVRIFVSAKIQLIFNTTFRFL